jgi:hypothetical protein
MRSIVTPQPRTLIVLAKANASEPDEKKTLLTVEGVLGDNRGGIERIAHD